MKTAPISPVSKTVAVKMTATRPADGRNRAAPRPGFADRSGRITTQPAYEDIHACLFDSSTAPAAGPQGCTDSQRLADAAQPDRHATVPAADAPGSARFRYRPTFRSEFNRQRSLGSFILRPPIHRQLKPHAIQRFDMVFDFRHHDTRRSRRQDSIHTKGWHDIA